MLLIRISDDHDREACCKKQVCVHTRVLQLWYGRTTVFLAAKKSMHSARGARAGFHKFSYFPLHGTRAARAHGFDSPPPSRTLEPLAFDEYCRFDTSAFFLDIKRGYMHGENLRKFTETRARAPRARHALIFCQS